MKHYLPSTNQFFPVKGCADARRAGYRSLTKPYHLNHKDESIRYQEREWWDNLCRDLQRCRCVIVEYSSGVELWRHEDELDVDPMTGLKQTKHITKDE